MKSKPIIAITFFMLAFYCGSFVAQNKQETRSVHPNSNSGIVREISTGAGH